MPWNLHGQLRKENVNDFNTEILEWTGVVLAFLFGLTMICQGHFIYHQKYGYSRKETEDPEARDRVRRQIEKAIRGNREDDSSS